MAHDDREQLRVLARRIMAHDPASADRAKARRHRGDVNDYVVKVREKLGGGLEALEGGGLDEELALETIVVREGRPVLLVENDDYKLAGPETETWKVRLDLPDVRKVLRSILPAVGRIEVDNNPSYTWIGTGWLVDDDIVVTNRHVAGEFGTRGPAGFTFRRGWPDATKGMSSRIDFKEELGVAQANEFRVLDILHIEEDDGPDIALLKVERTASNGRQLAGKLRLAGQRATEQQFVATIGYPAADSRVPDQDLVRRIFGDVYNVKRLAPGQVIRSADGLVLHDCSTLGGNSGSPIVDLTTGEAIGLHFSGLFLKENRGVAAALVADRLRKAKSGSVHPIAPAGSDTKPPDAVAVRSVRFEVTVPIELSVNVGTPRLADRAGAAGGSTESVERAVAEARSVAAGRREVLAVRDGYVFRDGWITDERAVVVVVRDTAASLEGMGLPARIGGVPVEVRPASPADYALSMGILEALEGFPATTYEPPANVRLEPVEKKMKVVCHLCPDAGWPTLQDFLKRTKKRLVVGMYDFTAPHIVDGVLAASKAQPRKLTLVLQARESLGGGTKANDVHEEDTVDRYRDALGDRFDFSWASVGKNHRFASAYHIKVAVRDGKEVWLSSGNWQSSNQPDHGLAAGETSWNLLMKHNREWNVVVENDELASQFEAFLEHDLEQAKADAGLEAAEGPDLEFLVEPGALPERVPSGTPTYLEPLVVDRTVRVQPLLTPDNYQEHALALIEGAQEQILFQNQSFSILDDGKNDERYVALFDALLAKQRAGVDVRIVLRGDFGPEQVLERLKSHGFDTDRIRFQDRCHTKGIVVDRRVVLVGSHNWTNQGTLVNRDASLIFFDEEIARYFAEAFWFDWKKLARKSVAGGARVRLAGDDEAPAGSVRLTWREIVL